MRQQGFYDEDVDLVSLARGYVGKSKYRRGAKLSEAPQVFDCSGFMKWLYGLKGIWIPRRSVQQRAEGNIVDPRQLVAGDLVFTSGWINYYEDDPKDGVGHVAMATGEGTAIHCSHGEAGVAEVPIAEFLKNDRFRGARRLIPQGVKVVTFLTPKEREVETSDDIKWIVRQSMKE